MKINIEDYLHKIDTYFVGKTQKDIYMLYIMIFATLFAFSYLLFWDSSEDMYISQSEQITNIKTKIAQDELYMKINPIEKVQKLEEEIKLAQEELVKNKENNQYIRTKIETISALIYDERTWGEYLYSISQDASKYNVKILEFTNKLANQKEEFGHVLDIRIKTEGAYKNTLKFINSIEKSDLVVDIHHLKIEAKDALNSDLNISVWGIAY